ncbi:conserved Plasmodium protein, unknown function [Plasmodium relictum]|uniref:Uncharacterized protein n=1 Tax=Plasmodium relictum TaxID=85471 RepID=A0A1J1H960_PLARL|nr:conserved Plasmodium protein, unknown function [Plasmodium relictum]CRH01173.1 conserved Plasmodium protein, unknown function [Plasmodium relictum]
MENLNNKSLNKLKIYFYKWIEILEQISKNKETNLFIFGLYSMERKKNIENKEFHYEQLEKNNSNSDGIIYKKLCLGIRYIELIILKNKNKWDDEIEINEEKKEMNCLYEGRYFYNISDILQEISVFIKNKQEKIILSFLESNDDDDEKINAENKNVTYYNIEKLDIYIYLYLRKYLNYLNNEKNYKILYFYNSKERIINLSKYDFDIDNFKIRNWVFNNISLLLPSKIIQENEQKENRHNFLSVDSAKSSLKLSHKHHLSLFRLNSITEEETSNLTSKILVNRKLPNILVHDDKEYNKFSEKSDNYALDNPSKNNCILYYLEYSNNEYKNATFHKLSAYDINLNVNQNFIGYNNMPLTEYIIDRPKKLKLQNSPFIYTNKKLIYLYEYSYKSQLLDKIDDNYYYVLKIEKENIEDVLVHIHNNINIKNNKNFISILTTNCYIDHVFTIIKFNLKCIMNI